VLDGDTDPPPPRGTAPNLCPISVAAKWLDGPMPLGRKVSLDLSDIVLDGDPAPPPEKGTDPQFSAMHVYCAQTAGWIKIPLGIEAGLDSMGTELPPPQKGTQPTILAHVYCGQSCQTAG